MTQEMQRTVEFIVQQQAQYAVNILLQEDWMRDSARIARLEESFPLLVQLAQTTDSRSDKLESRAAAFEANIAGDW